MVILYIIIIIIITNPMIIISCYCPFHINVYHSQLFPSNLIIIVMTMNGIDIIDHNHII